ncbi:MAG: macro domain-containing protein [Oscillospiraceae bacterium]|nr:macro domain-containing protein [Oscillospiraceae bacterium]
MPFKIVRNDITKMQVDAIVNAANTSLAPGGGVCGAIFEAAGYDKLASECSKIGHCNTGDAVITKGYNLPAKYIIHTPGPVYRGGMYGEEKLLYSCYRSSLELAKSKRIKSIAFPLISSGIYGYPKAEALRVATGAITDFLEDNETDIYLVVYDKKSFEISSGLFSDVAEYIEENLIKPDARLVFGFEKAAQEDIDCQSAPMPYGRMIQAEMSAPAASIDDMIKNMDASFSEYLLMLIDKSGMTDAQVYKKANVDRKLFSKIRNNRQYKPSKVTAVAFALALGLDMDGTRDLIGRAGYALTRSSKFDIIIEYFIIHGNYNIFEINETLFAFDQPLIGV